MELADKQGLEHDGYVLLTRLEFGEVSDNGTIDSCSCRFHEGTAAGVRPGAQWCDFDVLFWQTSSSTASHADNSLDKPPKKIRPPNKISTYCSEIHLYALIPL